MQQVYLRSAIPEDVDLLYEWANDVDVRANSFQTQQISYENHLQWFDLKMKDVNCHILIGMVKEESIGVIRFECSEDQGIVNYSIAAEKRGLGYGKQLVEQGLQYATHQIPMMTCIFAQVKASNTASCRIFEALGFIKNKIEDSGDYLYEKLHSC